MKQSNASLVSGWSAVQTPASPYHIHMLINQHMYVYGGNKGSNCPHWVHMRTYDELFELFELFVYAYIWMAATNTSGLQSENIDCKKGIFVGQVRQTKRSMV